MELDDILKPLSDFADKSYEKGWMLYFLVGMILVVLYLLFK